MRATLAVLVFGIATAAKAADPPVCYQLTRLLDQDPRLATAVAMAINNKGEVVGHIISASEPTVQPFVWSSTTGTRLMDIPVGTNRGSGSDINDSGLVCGWLLTDELDLVGYLWSSRNQVDPAVSLLKGIIPSTISNGPGSAGVLLGGTSTEGEGPPVVWRRGNLFELTFPGMGYVEGINEITDINSKGVVVGTLMREDFVAAPFRWNSRSVVGSLFVEELPGPPEYYFRGRANGINELGDIVGSMADLYDESIAAWKAPELDFVDLGQVSPAELVSLAQSVNNNGYIVGYSPNDHPLGLDTAWLYSEGAFHDLNFLVVDLPPGVEVYRAWDINDESQVLVQLVANGSPTAFDWAILEPDWNASCPGGTGDQ